MLVVTSLAVAGLGGWFALAQWDQANKIATMTSAIGAVAAVGVAVWAVLRGPGVRSVRAMDTGTATATAGGSANSGIRGKPTGQAQAERTGNARSEGGDANTGIRIE